MVPLNLEGLFFKWIYQKTHIILKLKRIVKVRVFKTLGESSFQWRVNSCKLIFKRIIWFPFLALLILPLNNILHKNALDFSAVNISMFFDESFAGLYRVFLFGRVFLALRVGIDLAVLGWVICKRVNAIYLLTFVLLLQGIARVKIDGRIFLVDDSGIDAVSMRMFACGAACIAWQ